MGFFSQLVKLFCDPDSVHISAGGGDASWSKEDYIRQYGTKDYERQIERQRELKKPYDERSEKWR